MKLISSENNVVNDYLCATALYSILKEYRPYGKIINYAQTSFLSVYKLTG